jgi:hypothetical protein
VSSVASHPKLQSSHHPVLASTSSPTKPESTTMEHHRSLGSPSVGSRSYSDGGARFREEGVGFRSGSIINFLGNSHLRTRVAFKMVATSREMEDMHDMLSNYALVVKEEGSMGLHSYEELSDLITYQFGFCKYAFYVYRSWPEPFVVIFSYQHMRDMVFAVGRTIERPVELQFSARELDEFGERAMTPFHVRLSLEGMPQHAWS